VYSLCSFVCLPPCETSKLGSRSELLLSRSPSGARVEILDLRHFSAVDLRPLLDDETQVWQHLLSWDYSGSAAMILRYVDAKILPGYAAVDRGLVFG
jgi:hypothetical protein